MMNIKKMLGTALIFALLISRSFIASANTDNAVENSGVVTEYETEIFGTDIVSIEIIADEDDWQTMLDNAVDEQFIMVDVIVNGTKFQNVGIRPKGNSSLSQVASSTSDRYSFRLQFDEYIKDQTCFGLESFVVNNMLTDNTYMKEYVSYELMEEVGVDAPKFAYANMIVNGENWGLYLSVELYNKSYENRVFGDTSGMLYNVKNTKNEEQPDVNQPAGIQGAGAPVGNAGVAPGQRPNNLAPTTPQDSPVGNRTPTGMNAIRGNVGTSGGSLEYTDNDTTSYSSIFENVVGKGTESDYEKVIVALKTLSEGEDLETYFDIDQILRYLAAHTIVVNLDSYSSSMTQNYYIFEKDGVITILPWDYNQAWGGFQSDSATSVVNFPIDTPVSGVEMSSRPLIEKLLTNPEYLERYHSYLQELVDGYFSNGKFEETIIEIDSLISNYVKEDATAFISYDEYKTAVSNFIILGNLRAESVQGQLDGTIPATTTGQAEAIDSLVSTTELNLSALGSSASGGAGARGGKGGLPTVGARNPAVSQPEIPPVTSLIPIGSGESGAANNVLQFGGLTAVLGSGLIFAKNFKRRF